MASRIGINGIAALAAKDGSDVPVINGDPRILEDFVPAQEPSRSDCAGHPVARFKCSAKDIATSKMPRNDSRRQGLTLGGERMRTLATKAIALISQMRLHKKANIVENLFAHLDVAQLGCMGELQFFPKPVQNSGIEIGSLVQQQQQFRGGGCVLIVGLQTTRCSLW